MCTVGIDIGSVTAKGALMSGDAMDIKGNGSLRSFIRAKPALAH